MSAGGKTPHAVSNFDGLAPLFAEALMATIVDCKAAGLDAVVFETTRSKELAALYYTRGRPPSDEYPTPVTGARDASHTWHGYGLAADIISASKEWGAGDAWFATMGAIAQSHGLTWGGDWKRKDLPHVQWGRCAAAPSAISQALYAQGTPEAVWPIVRAA